MSLRSCVSVFNLPGRWMQHVNWWEKRTPQFLRSLRSDLKMSSINCNFKGQYVRGCSSSEIHGSKLPVLPKNPLHLIMQCLITPMSYVDFQGFGWKPRLSRLIQQIWTKIDLGTFFTCCFVLYFAPQILHSLFYFVMTASLFPFYSCGCNLFPLGATSFYSFMLQN